MYKNNNNNNKFKKELSCTKLFKGFVATFSQSLKTFFITTRTRRNDIFGAEFLGRNLSLSVHCISSPYKWLSCRCCHVKFKAVNRPFIVSNQMNRVIVFVCNCAWHIVVFNRLSHRLIKTSHCPYHIDLLTSPVATGQGPLRKALSRSQGAPAENIISAPIASLPWKR